MTRPPPLAAPTCRARAAALLVTLCTTATLASSPCAVAGPREARERWREAQALDGAPWRERVAAFRAVRREAGATDPYGARALAAEARALREGGRVAVAAAAEAQAATRGPWRDPDRLAHALTAARALGAEEDATGAEAWFVEVVEAGGATTPARTGPALEGLGRLAADRGDEGALAALVERADRLVPDRVDTRLVLRDRLGMRALRRGDRAGAERMLAAQRRLYALARREGGLLDRIASRTWLSLALPPALDAR